MGNRSFSEEIYKLQVVDYEAVSHPKLTPREKRKPIVRARFPDELYSSDHRYKEMSTECYTISEATKINPSFKVSMETVTRHEIYNTFDKELGVVREIKDPFVELIERARRALVNPKLSKPRLQIWLWINDYSLDDNHSQKSATHFIWYHKKRSDDPNYKPKITTTINRTKLSQEFKGIQIVDGEEHEIWKDTNEPNQWDHLLENYSYAIRTVYDAKLEMGLGDEDGSREVIPFFYKWMPDIYEHGAKTGKEYIEKYGRDSAIVLYYFAHDGDTNEMLDLFEILDPEVDTGSYRPEAQLLRNLISFYEQLRKGGNPDNPLPPELQTVKELEAKAKLNAANEVQPVKPRVAPNLSGAPTLLDCLYGDADLGIPAYMEVQKWEDKRTKTKLGIARHIKNCTGIIGNLPVDQINPNHGYAIAEHFHNRINKKGLRTANKTIGTYISDMETFSKFILHRVRNPQTNRSWMKYNPFSDLDISGYGEKKRSYESLDDKQLYDLFAAHMPNNHRLIFELLIKTGMRLDEVILLKREQLKTGSKPGEKHIRYFDLGDAITKTDKFSSRNVVLPDNLKLPDKGTGIIFPEWQKYLNADGKGSKEASRQLMEKYVKPIRYDEKDDRKTVHSLRHNLIGLMENLTDPAAIEHHMDWIAGHGMEGGMTDSERKRSYGSDPELINKYNIVNRILHPWCEVK